MGDPISISDCFHFSDDFESSGEILTMHYYEWSENENPSLFKVSKFDTCSDGNGGVSCCTSANPCGDGKGDCDYDEECIDGLRCGQGNGLDDNCNSLLFPASYDCCYEPEG